MEKNKIDYSELGKERIITIADLIREIGRRIWIVVVLAVVFALIFGAYKYYRDMRDVEKATAASEEDIVADTSLTDEEIAEVQNDLYIKSNIEDLQNYIENSVLMQINAADESQVVLQYRMEVPAGATARRDSQDLVASYQSYVSDRMLAADLEENGYGLDVQYLGELISIDTESDTEEEEVTESEEELPVSASFTITVVQKDQASVEQLADLIEGLMESYRDTLTDSIGGHDLTLINRSYMRIVDTDRRMFKYDRINNLTTMQEKVEEMEADFSSAQKDLLEQYEALDSTSGAEEEEIGQASTEESEETTVVRISRRYVAIGIVVGIVIALIYIILAYILRGSINTANDIRYLYNLRVLGELKLSGKGILRKRKTRLTKEQQINMLVTNLKSACQENGIKKVLFNGSAKLTADWELAEQLAEEMKPYGVKIEYVTDLPYSSEAIDRLEETKAVVLLEKIRYADYTTIEAEIRTCMEHEGQILGAVVFS